MQKSLLSYKDFLECRKWTEFDPLVEPLGERNNPRFEEI